VFESYFKLKENGNYALSSSSIKTTRIPSCVENIGTKCFYGCKSLSEMTFGGSPSFGEELFNECPLKHVNVKKGLVLEYDFPESCVVVEIESNEEDCSVDFF
jgi:hypothetical protein